MCARSVDLLKALKAYATESTCGHERWEQLQSGYIRHKTGHTQSHTHRAVLFHLCSTYTRVQTHTPTHRHITKQNRMQNTHRRVNAIHIMSSPFNSLSSVIYSHYRHSSFSLSRNNKLVASAHKSDCRIDTIINTITQSFSPSYNSSLINTVINGVNKSHKHSETHSAKNKGLVTQ